MSSQTFPPLIEAFLILEQPRQRLSHWTQALAPLDHERAPPLASVDGYYDPTFDQALLGVSYDELALGGEGLAYIVDVALRAQIGMIQPSELSADDRRRILGERLARCTVRVIHQRSVFGALAELVRRVSDEQRAPRLQPAAPAVTLGRGSFPPVPDRLQPPKPALDRGRLPRVQIPALIKPAGGPAMPKSERRLSRHVIPRAPSPAPSLPAPARAVAAAAAVAAEESRDRMATAEMNPLDAQKLAATHLSPVASVLDEPTRTHVLPGPQAVLEPSAEGSQEMPVSDPYASVVAPLPPGCIYARYLRSGRWVPVRVGALSLRGAALMAGALPRVRDPVEIALGYADLRAMARGRVHKISTTEEAARRGAASFSVVFDLDDGSRRQLTALLHAARAANVTIKPPPPRGDRRIPIQWPVVLSTPRGALRAEALDASREGLFVRYAEPLTLETRVAFSISLDDGLGPMTARTRVARFIDEAAARSCGVVPGYGLHIIEMSSTDRERWLAFVDRIERRAERRVLVGTTRNRLRELQVRLAAAGYAVATATDPDALVQLASGDERAVDACLIDAGWMPPGRTGTWSEALFPTRTVPCVAVRGDVRRAREALDQVLSIV